jgi:AAA+ superfamily predicted ATPase
MFTDPMAHLTAALARLDLLLHREILRLRAAYQLSLDEFRGLYISDAQVDSCITQVSAQTEPMPVIQELTERAEALRQKYTAHLGTNLPWFRLVTAFDLSPVEQDCLLIALAPEIDLKYETLYAYLNNDVTRKWPTHDLALRLLSPGRSCSLPLRRYLLPQAPLFHYGLLQPVQAIPGRPSWLACGFCLMPVVAHFLLGHTFQNPELTACVEYRKPTTSWEEVPVSAEQCGALCQIVKFFQSAPANRPTPVLFFVGRYGTGRSQAAEAICRELGITLLRVDLEAMRATGTSGSDIMRELIFQQRLLRAGVYLDYGEALFDKEGHPLPEAYRLIRALAQSTGPLFFACTPGVSWQELFHSQRCLAFHFDDPDVTQRRRLWETSLMHAGTTVPSADIDILAQRFILTPGQIRHTVTAVIDHSTLCHGSAETLSLERLADAARAQSGQSLSNVALKVSTSHSWNDLVLPPATLRRVQEIVTAVKYRHIVYAQWGFARRIASGRGLKVLFTGTSGTGKTMTAGVMACDLGLDLYKIDLSGVVSKYIGETEKNLERIFRAAHCSNAILFFDEADALFGKRSEVKDAHDRYANIEVAYLLQRLEEYDGAVILASNLSKNIDEAFSRRMHYVVEFPLPDEPLRERLWRSMFPPEVPLGQDVDCRFLAKQFSITGGDIKNVVLDAAFLAVQDGRGMTMKHLMQAMARQMIKQGKIPSATDFKQYYALLAPGA